MKVLGWILLIISLLLGLPLALNWITSPENNSVLEFFGLLAVTGAILISSSRRDGRIARMSSTDESATEAERLADNSKVQRKHSYRPQ